MPRGRRQFEVGGIYHIINRGVEKRKIFLKNQDYSRFVLSLELFNNATAINIWDLFKDKNTGPDYLSRIKQLREKIKHPFVAVLAFALMPNHFHLVIREIRYKGISLFMRKLGGYSTYFNKQYERVGPLFQSRYKVVPIKSEPQLHAVFAYVHTNPVELVEPGWKDFKVKDPRKAAEYLAHSYRWSSYQDYIGKINFPKVVEKEFFENFYGTRQRCQQAIEDWIRYKAKKTGHLIEFGE